MKVNGRTLDKPNEVLLVLPREDGDLVFKFRAIVDTKDFENLCPQPSPPRVKKTGGDIYFNVEDPSYKAAIEDYASKQTHWQFLQSISATDGLEWSKVKMDDSNSWSLWREEFQDAGFSIGEMNAIWAHFIKANNLNAAMIEEARARFLSSQKQQVVES